MRILILKITLRASWVSSLKEKRMIVKSVIQRLKNKFNISVAEIAKQDEHKIIEIGIISICGSLAQADSISESILNFVESSTDAEIINIAKEEEIL